MGNHLIKFASLRKNWSPSPSFYHAKVEYDVQVFLFSLLGSRSMEQF